VEITAADLEEDALQRTARRTGGRNAALEIE
jgi:hypothetical protein